MNKKPDPIPTHKEPIKPADKIKLVWTIMAIIVAATIALASYYIFFR